MFLLVQARREKEGVIAYTVDFNNSHSVAVNGEHEIGITGNRDDTQAIAGSLHNVYDGQIRRRSTCISALNFFVN